MYLSVDYIVLTIHATVIGLNAWLSTWLEYETHDVCRF